MMAENLIFISIMSSWIILSVLTNVGVLLVILPNQRMQSVTTIYMCNLAISDIFLAAFVLPQNIHDMSHRENYYEGEFHDVNVGATAKLHKRRKVHFPWRVRRAW